MYKLYAPDRRSRMPGLNSPFLLSLHLGHSAETCSAVASILFILVTFPAIETQDRSDETYLFAMLFTSVNLIVTLAHIGQLEYHGMLLKS